MSRLHRGGRPPKKKTERLNILLSDTEYNDCQRCAEVLECSMAEVIREGIKRVKRQLVSQGKWDAVPPAEAGEPIEKVATSRADD